MKPNPLDILFTKVTRQAHLLSKVRKRLDPKHPINRGSWNTTSLTLFTDIQKCRACHTTDPPHAQGNPMLRIESTLDSTTIEYLAIRRCEVQFYLGYLPLEIEETHIEIEMCYSCAHALTKEGKLVSAKAPPPTGGMQ